MEEKKITFLVVPEKGKIYSKKISVYLIYSTLLVLVFFLTVGIFSGINYLKLDFDRKKLSSLKEENRYLENEITELFSVISQLKDQMGTLIQREKNIRMVFDLPEVDDAIREVGIGGPDLDFYPFKSEASEEVRVVEKELDKLLRQAKFEKESFDQIYSQLVSKKEVLDHTPSIWPAKSYLSRGFGVKPSPFTGLKQPHLGIDIAASKGTPVWSTACGIVEYTGWHKGLGKLIIIDHGYGYKTHYGHLNEIKVKRGQRIKRGKLLGTIGNTGYSTGPHLHYEVHYKGKAVNPQKYILSENFIVD